MIPIEQTGIEELSFGDSKEDIFHILVNKQVSPNGIDLDKLRLADPRNFDAALTSAGCIIMLNEIEIEELARRGELNPKKLHQSLYELAEQEGLL
ncbi:MAG: hypothetical protein ABJ387_03245 [Balneola sp.]|jgi:hypothetical protein|uniref:hypothetical protein n=1 Tax=Balneola sp. EhC07 TaxID=1849360 RepID=UPI0007F3FBA0|nr:hypothetical protein [Balneola sp. EhC07]OAN61036.1 hypothetical protein A8B79_06065 [Balneola sp. EhC07]